MSLYEWMEKNLPRIAKMEIGIVRVIASLELGYDVTPLQLGNTFNEIRRETHDGQA